MQNGNSTLKKLFLLGGAVFIFALNLWIAKPLLSGDYNFNLESIEVALFTDAKHIVNNFPKIWWYPKWYLGYPFILSYNPVFPFTLAVLKIVFPLIELSRLYRVFSAVTYALLPVGVLGFVYGLKKRVFPALLAALVFSLVPSVGYVYPFVREAVHEFGLSPWQGMVLATYGEGPHLLSLFFALLGDGVYFRLLKSPSSGKRFLFSLLLALTMLTSWTGTVAFAVLMAVIFFSEMLLGDYMEKLKETFLGVLVAYGLAAFWFNLTFMREGLFFGNTGRGEISLISTYLRFLPFLIVGVPLLLGFLSVILSGKEKIQEWVIAVMWFGGLAIVVTLGYLYSFQFLPQPQRYLLEACIAAAVLAALIADSAVEKLGRLGRPVKLVLGVVLLVAPFIYLPWATRGADFLFRHYGSREGEIERVIKSAPRTTKTDSYKDQAGKTIEDSYEYRFAQLAVEIAGKERIFMTGKPAFWLDYWTDIPQVRGAADPGATHPWWDDASYQILTGEGVEKGEAAPLALDWLKALNVRYIFVNDPQSAYGFHYKDYKDPGKFEGVLKKTYDDGDGNMFYEVPLNQPGLAQLADARTGESLPELKSAIDIPAVAAYAAWVDSEEFSPLDFRWLNPQEFEIRGDILPGTFVSTQITFDKGWHAYVDGASWRTRADVVGNLLIVPESGGEVLIHGIYKPTWDVKFGWVITLGTVVCLVGIGFRKILNPKLEAPNKL